MKLVDQSIVDENSGDCFRAAIASLFELELSQVPHFRLFADDKWFAVFWYYLLALGWEYIGWGTSIQNDIAEHTINGYVCARVTSKTFPDRIHSVIIDVNGTVVHDPNPNKLYQGINVIESGELQGWYMIAPKDGKELQVDA